MTAQVGTGSTKVPIALSFGTLSVADAAGTLNTSVASIKEKRMPVPGSIIGISQNLSGTLLTGTLTFYPTKNGSPMTNSFTNGTINISTFGNYETDIGQQGGFSFAAGDTIGVGYNKQGTITPTTRDLEVLLFVLLDGYNY